VGDAVVDLCPMADGGQGTVDAMVAATGGRLITADVFDPLGAPIRARFGMLGRPGGSVLPGELGLAAMGPSDQPADSGVAIIEMAAASGLQLVAPEMRDPMRSTTFGTGQLMLEAIGAGAREVIIGIGGSATVDGGCGCAQALGVRFTSADGQPCICGLGGGGLADIAAIDLSTRDARVGATRIRVACDVTNPLTGPNGAAAVFGPQKGATPEMVHRLDANLHHLAGLIRRQLGVDVEMLPGGGAAGGLGAGLVAFAGAALERGVEIVAGAVGLRNRLRDADLCITGEGRLDGSSRGGKTAVGVAAMAAELGVPVVCVPGQMADDAPLGPFAIIRPLADEMITVRQAMQRTAELLTIRAAEAVRMFMRM
jgi:glycerate kinase